MGGIKERLDRFCGTASWKNLFAQADVTYLKSCKYDHIPIMLEVTPGSTRRIHRLFQFEEIWTHHEEYEEIIREAWATSVVGVPMYQVCEKIKTTRMTLNTWHHKTFKARQAEIEVIHDKITSIDSLPYTNTAMEERSEFIHQLDSLLLENESHWKQRSRLNDQYGVWRSNDLDVEKVVLDYFNDLFHAQSQS
ncbi:hypothetical protein ACFX14_019273 [Malus domestica]